MMIGRPMEASAGCAVSLLSVGVSVIMKSSSMLPEAAVGRRLSAERHANWGSSLSPEGSPDPGDPAVEEPPGPHPGRLHQGGDDFPDELPELLDVRQILPPTCVDRVGRGNEFQRRLVELAQQKIVEALLLWGGIGLV